MTMSTAPQKTERLEARMTRQQKARIEEAARLRGTSVTEFVVMSSQEAAARTIREHEVLTLAERSRKVFVDALLNPPKPSARALAAAKRYQQKTGS